MGTRFVALGIAALVSLPLLAQDPPPTDKIYLDFNGDGEDDLWYEWGDLSYLQHVDRNHDGKPDETFQFDNRTNWALMGRLDDDFDGYFETQVVMQNNSPTHALVDSDKDNFVDIIYSYVHGVPISGRKYVAAATGGKHEVITFDIEYGFAVNKRRVETSLTPEEFHEDSMSDLQTVQEMPR